VETPQTSERGVLGKLPRNIWIMTLTSFLTDISSEMVLNLLPLYLANVLGASTAVIGLIEGIAETCASLLKGISGWLSDKLQQRKWLAVAGYGLSALSKPFLYVASTWQAVLAVRASDRIGKGIRTSPRDALIADTIDERHRGTAFGLHRAGDTAGAFTGLVIALVVVLIMQAQKVDLSRSTFQLLVLISILPAFLSVIVLAFGAKDVALKVKAEQVRLNFMALDSRFRGFLFILAIFTLGNSSDAFLVLLAQQRGLSIAGVLGMLITFNAVYALLAGPAGALSDRVGRRRLMIMGWLAYAILYLGFAITISAWQIWALYALYGLYYAATEGAAKALVADLVPSEQRGTAYGYYNAAIGIMALPASLLAGILWQGFGPSAPFVAGFALALTAGILLLLWFQRTQQARGNG